jgi:hypothetical protein
LNITQYLPNHRNNDDKICNGHGKIIYGDSNIHIDRKLQILYGEHDTRSENLDEVHHKNDTKLSAGSDVLRELNLLK